MDSEKICLASKTIDISEHETYIELLNRLCYYDGENLNNVMLPYKGVEDDAKRMASTLVNMPLQAKYKKVKGLDDLGGHELSIDKDGNAVWGTTSIGTHTSAWISEPEDVITVTGEKKKLPCLYATARVWKRNPNIISAIKRLFASEGGLNSSWEISTNAYEYSHGIKKLTDYEFLGNTCLGSQVTPAYSGTSKTVSISSEMIDSELMIAEALALDMNSENNAFEINDNDKKEVNILDKDNITLSSEVTEEVTISEETTETENPIEEVSESVEKNETPENETSEAKEEINNQKPKTSEGKSETEVSALTERDLRRRIAIACDNKIGDNSWCYIAFWFPEDKVVWCEYSGRQSQLDFMKFTYEVNGETVTVSDGEKVTLTVEPTKINDVISEYEKTIAEKDELIVKVSSEITDLKAQNTELSQYKEKFTQIEQEKAEAELAQKKEELIASVIKSGQISRSEIEESEELQGYVNTLDKKSLMAIVGERLSASVCDKPEKEIETSEVKKDIHVSSNLNNEDDEVVDKASIMRNFLRK